MLNSSFEIYFLVKHNVCLSVSLIAKLNSAKLIKYYERKNYSDFREYYSVASD